MDAELNHRLNYELRRLKDDRDKYVSRLDRCNGVEKVRLRKTKRSRGNYYYYAKKDGSDKYVYLGTRDRPDVKRICEAHFLKETIARIDSNITMINSFLEGYLPTDAYAVNAALSSAYHSEILPITGAYEREGEKWKTARLAFQAEYPENYPEYKTETTSDGVKVKSVSEALLYERFKSAGFFQIYELPLVLKDHGPAIYPDFTILSPVDMKTQIYVEYVGRLNLPKYREDFARRLHRYISNGYKPGVNVFFIFSDSNGHIDSMQINRVIAEIRGI